MGMKNSFMILLAVFCIPLSSWSNSRHHEITAQPSDKTTEHADNVTMPAQNTARSNPVLVHKSAPTQAKQKEELAVYNGPIEHNFFHPLIIDPELAFDGDAKSKGYDDYFVTVKEFKKMLDSMHHNDFMLIKMSDLFQEQKIKGKVTLTRNELKLPKNKKPFVLSVDDFNYYQYMKANGNAYKLLLIKTGNLPPIQRIKLGLRSFHETMKSFRSLIPL
jgi:hypothetical protein